MSFFHLHPFRKHGHPPAFWIIYALAVIFNFHSLLVAYSNSSYLESFLSAQTLSILYSVGSIISVGAFILMTGWLRFIGNFWLTIILAILELAALLILGFAPGLPSVVVAFLLFLVINPLLYFSLDIFSETLIGSNESETGSKRGLTLALMSAASVCSPLALAIIVGNDSSLLYRTYLFSGGIFVLFIILTALNFRNFSDPVYPKVKLLESLMTIWNTKAMRHVCSVHFAMQVFFSWMVIYLPLYLTTVLGYSWEEVGSIIAVALFAYVIFEFPVGWIADHWWGEKEMMGLGMMVIIVTVAGITFMESASLGAWMLLMFINRFGASLVEVTTESYFFKQTNGGDTHSISFFRLLRPLSMVAGSILGVIALSLVPFSFAFIILALALVPCLFSIQFLQDSK